MYSNDADRPLFGEARTQDRYLNYAVGAITSLMVLETLISAFVFPLPPKGLHIFLAIVIVMVCVSELLLIYWYRQGDLEPKFRQLIFYNSFTILLLCVAANLIFHDSLVFVIGLLYMLFTHPNSCIVSTLTKSGHLNGQ